MHLTLATALLGSMVFFPFVVAPVVFRVLAADQAGAFLRAMFPRYYLWGMLVSLAALLLALNDGPRDFLLLSLVFIGFVLSRQVLMPGINEAQDRVRETGEGQSRRRFQRLHQLSVVINVVQALMLAALVLLS